MKYTNSAQHKIIGILIDQICCVTHSLDSDSYFDLSLTLPLQNDEYFYFQRSGWDIEPVKAITMGSQIRIRFVLDNLTSGTDISAASPVYIGIDFETL